MGDPGVVDGDCGGGGSGIVGDLKVVVVAGEGLESGRPGFVCRSDSGRDDVGHDEGLEGLEVSGF